MTWQAVSVRPAAAAREEEAAAVKEAVKEAQAGVSTRDMAAVAAAETWASTRPLLIST